MANIQLFRERLTDVPQCNDWDNYRLDKWLKARNYDIDKAEIMLRESITFKRRMATGNLIDSYSPPEVIKKYLAGGFCGFDKDGSPVRIELFGYLDMRGIMLSTRKVDLEKTKLLQCEKTLLDWKMMSEKMNKKVDGLTVIFDMEDVGTKSLWRPGLQMYLHLVKILEDNYPEMMKRLFVINAPMIFPILWKICRPLISEDMKNKIHVLGSDYKTILLKYIDSNDLPQYLGGEKCDPDGNGRCPSIICQGGDVPKAYYLTELAYANNMSTIIVQNGDKFTMNIDVAFTGSVLKWEFMTEDFDIGFGIARMINSKEENVLCNQRYSCHLHPEEGSYVCDSPGDYQVYFDNSYSWTKPKKLFYSIELHVNDTETNDMDEVISTGSWVILSNELRITRL